MPGGTTQLRPAVHIVPRPPQVRQDAWPAASVGFGIVVPQATAVASGQFGQHEPIASHVEPAAQRVPVPVHAWLPMHVGGMLVPQSTMPAPTHVVVQVQAPATHARPPAHGPLQ